MCVLRAAYCGVDSRRALEGSGRVGLVRREVRMIRGSARSVGGGVAVVCDCACGSDRALESRFVEVEGEGVVEISRVVRA